VNETVIVGEVVAGQAAKVKAALKKAIKTHVTSVFDVLEGLHEVRKNKYYQPDFNTMTEYCETLGLKPRKSQYLLRIAEVMEAVGLTRAQFEPAGISNLREICRLDPAGVYENPVTHEKTPMKDWILALVADPEITLDSLQENVRILLGHVGDDATKWVNIPLKRIVYFQTYLPALEKAKSMIGTVGKTAEGMAIDPSDASALEMILADFLAGGDLEKAE
jgi:hypothetical protein